MKFASRLASMVSWILRRSRAEAKLDEEMRAFIDMSAAQKMREAQSRGEALSDADARRLARLELGGIEQVKEQVRTRRHGALLDDTARDVRYAFRSFARHRGFTAVVLLTLALGIGANTAIFSLIDALMLRSLAVTRPGELLLLQLRERDEPGPGGESFSYDLVRALDRRGDARDRTGLATARVRGSALLGAGGGAAPGQPRVAPHGQPSGRRFTPTACRSRSSA